MSDQSMRALCPSCGGEGNCDQADCVDGYLQYNFAKGNWYTRLCLNHVDCGFANGGRICETYPPESSGPCVNCGGKTDWVLFEEVDSAGDEPGYVKNRDKFAIDTLQKMNDTLRERLKNVITTVANWPEVQSRDLTKDECRMLNICCICREPAVPTKEKGSFCYSPWAHAKCCGADDGPAIIYLKDKS